MPEDISGIGWTKVLINLKDFSLRREIQGSLFPWGCLEKCFLVFRYPRTQRHCSCGPRGPEYYLSWQQSLASSTRCWFCRHIECKSFRVIEASTEILKESLGL
jgi:hypothetical protein